MSNYATVVDCNQKLVTNGTRTIYCHTVGSGKAVPNIWGKGAVAASSTLQRVLPREVTHVRPKSHIPLLRADDTWGRVPPHILINLQILGPRGPEPGQRPLSCRHPHLGWFSVGVRRLEEARATGLACRGAHSHLLTRSSLRSPGGPGVRSRSLWPVGRSYGTVAV